jgi:hypothetical protein
MKADLENLKKLFAKMKTDGFDTSRELRWGFLFIDNPKDALLEIYDELKDHGYTLVELESIEGGEWKLYVTKVDTLTAEGLHLRNIAFNELVDRYGVKLYDGWDVERVAT